MKFFDKLFGGREKQSLAPPPDLSTDGKKILKYYGFNLTEASDDNMWKYYCWTNSEFAFILTFDRGYYDCDVNSLGSGADFRMRLVPFLKFLKNDREFYNKELKEANLLRTLTPYGYVKLLHENYDLIKNYFLNYDPNKFEEYKKFDFDYTGI